MYDACLKQLEYISKAVGIPKDYTQGGGGNTSIKFDDTLMAVKASGFTLKQINSKEGYVVVNYKNIKKFYQDIDLTLDNNHEKESAEFIKNNIVEIEGIKKLRPSVEAGFHSILKKNVIHTHSVYANILCCTENCRELIGQIFKDKEYAVAWIPYVNPGFFLTLKINEVIRNHMDSYGKFPEVLFMQNHGLIVTCDDSQRCVKIHTEVNNTLQKYFGIHEAYPQIEIFRVDDGTFISKTQYLMNYFKNSCITSEFFNEVVLYPDQLVYLNDNVAIDRMNGKLNINTTTGEMIYKTGFAEAQTIEETLLAYIYVLEGIKKSGLTLKTMDQEEIDFIRNWESEAYRKSMAKKV